jgi:cytochrome P450
MAAFYLPYMYDSFIRGTMHNTIRKLHHKYGPIVRVGPNHLAVDGSVGWPDVYGHKAGQEEFGKVPEFLFQGDTTALIAAPKDVHRRQRRQLAHAFSDSALRSQEGIMKQYVDLLMSRFANKADTGESFNVIKWFDFTTFDIIGHLYHSEPFHCLESNGYHPWVSAFFNGFRGDSYRRFLRQFPLAHEVVKWLRVVGDLNSSTDNRDYIVGKAQARIKQGDFAIQGYRDFIAFMLKKNRDGEFGFLEPEILASSPLVITAGSETTASSLSALVFYLGSNPIAYERLTRELRSAFSDEEEITLSSTQRLEYLHACIEEALRVYPPVPETPPRQSPGGMIDGKWVPKGVSHPHMYFPRQNRALEELTTPMIRLLLRYSRWPPTTTPAIGLSPTHTCLRDGFPSLIPCTTTSSRTTIVPHSSHSATDQETVWVRTLLTLKCA